MNPPVKIFGEHDPATINQIYNCVRAGGERGVLCADGHKGYAQPIGGVIAYKDKVSISGVGFDIACGNLAIKTDAMAKDIKPDIKVIMDHIFQDISFGMGRSAKTKVDHELFEDPRWTIPALKNLKSLAESQLGTVGGGNHYVDIFEDEEGKIWVGVHFGSRGFGHKTATFFLKEAGGRDGMDVPPTVVDQHTLIGQDYIAGMSLAGRYAYAGREAVARYVVQNVLMAGIVEEVHNHHNFAWQEEHNGEKFWVVRKGATPAFPGQKGFIGGSMGDNAVIVEGVESDTSKEALYSTVHGAGRIMSRTAAKGRVDRKTGELKSIGAISRKQMDEWVNEKGVELRGGDVDESPQAYRRLPEVLAAHEGTIKILHTLKPIGVAMAGANVRDPYKD